jgi:hypothetical protein
MMGGADFGFFAGESATFGFELTLLSTRFFGAFCGVGRDSDVC